MYSWHAWAAIYTLGLAASSASAQADGPEATAAARMLAVEGVKLARAGDCQRAVEPLTRAESLHHSAIVLTELGACHVRLGRLVAGSEALRQVVREGLREAPSPDERQALSRAQGLLSEVLPKLAQLSLSVTSLGGEKVRDLALSVDGQTVPAALLGAPRPTDPGLHRVVATAPGFMAEQREVQLSEGESQQLELSLIPEPAPDAPPPAAARAPAEGPRRDPEAVPSSAPPERTTLRRVAYASWGVGAAGVAVGVVFGALARADKQQLDQHCDGNLCPASARAEIVEAKRWGVVSTAALASGAACTVAGSVAYLIARRTERRTATAWSAGLTLGGATARVQF